MKTLLVGLAAFCLGVLAALAFRLPWFAPLDPDLLEVLAALASALLTVVGAFGLWGYQVRNRQRALAEILVPVFEPVYRDLILLREVGSYQHATALLTFMRTNEGEPAPAEIDVLKFQADVFGALATGTITAADSAIQLWTSIQDLISGLQREQLESALELYQIAAGLPEKVRRAEERAKPKYLSQIAPQLEPDDEAMLEWAIGAFARNLNKFDRGSRDESIGSDIQSRREILIARWKKPSAK